MERWRAPEQGWLKVNVDGAPSKHADRGGGGVVLRDHSGSFRGRASYAFPSVSNPEVAEALAYRLAVLMATQEGATKVHVVVDNKELVVMLNEEDKEHVGDRANR